MTIEKNSALEIDETQGFVEITVNNKTSSVKKDIPLIEALEDLGVFVPRFCYHPRMQPVGVCRMCLVEIETPRGTSVQPSCFVPVSEGMKVITDSDRAKKAQDGVLEFLLINHPLDCPVCDKGGECPLQDQTLAYGPGESRFIEEKRHFPKPIKISSLIYLDKERCIQCARCTRFASEVAKNPLIDFAGRGEKLMVNVFESEPYIDNFSANIVQICPVGALTAKPYRFRARPWDLEQVESSCATCSMHCRIAVQSSASRVVRLLGVDVESLNQSWLCDKGRYGYEQIYCSSRLGQAQERVDGEFRQIPIAQGVENLAQKLEEYRLKYGADSIGFIGGSQLTNESIYSWVKFAKGVLCCDNFDFGMGDFFDPDCVFSFERASLDDLTDADCVLSIGCDLSEVLPVSFLRLSSELNRRDIKLIEIAVKPGSISKRLNAKFIGCTGDLTSCVDKAIKEGLIPKGAKIVVFVGREYKSDRELVPALLLLAEINSLFFFAYSRQNAFGALSLGAVPGYLPGGVKMEDGAGFFKEFWPGIPTKEGKSSREMLESANRGEIKLLVLLGADPISDFHDIELAKSALSSVEYLVSFDGHVNPSNEMAHLRMPCAISYERLGTILNFENRLSRVVPKVKPFDQALEDWEYVALLSASLGEDFEFASVEDILSELASASRLYSGLAELNFEDPRLSDGIFLPVGKKSIRVNRRWLDPVENSGISPVESQGAPIYVGEAIRYQNGESLRSKPSSYPSSAGTLEVLRQHYLSANEIPEPDDSEITDGFNVLKLFLRETLFDLDGCVSNSEALSKLIPEPLAYLNPKDLEVFGLEDGEIVELRNKKGAVTIRCCGDSEVVNGAVVVPVLKGATNVLNLADSSKNSLVVVESSKRVGI